MKRTKGFCAYVIIKNLILKDELDSGVMYSVSALAEKISMGRASVVDAIKRLESEGLLSIKPRQGIFIREMTVQEMKDINETRLVLEPYVIEKIIPILTSEDFVMLHKYLDDMERYAVENNYYNFITSDHGMHAYLHNLCGNRCIIDILKNLRDRIFTVGYKIVAKREGRMETTIQEHKNLIAALEERNVSKAVEAMRLHLVNGSKLI